jgi:hypothetical protein
MARVANAAEVPALDFLKRIFRDRRDAVIALLTVNLDMVVAELAERRRREGVVRAFRFLQAQHVRRMVAQKDKTIGRRSRTELMFQVATENVMGAVLLGRRSLLPAPCPNRKTGRLQNAQRPPTIFRGFGRVNCPCLTVLPRDLAPGNVEGIVLPKRTPCWTLNTMTVVSLPWASRMSTAADRRSSGRTSW